MSILSNSRHERFAQELAKGKTADEAYVLAGFKESRGNAARLKANDSIVGRLSELQERAADQTEVTVASLIREAEEVRQLAVENGQYSAAIAAIREKGILSGKRIERSEHGEPGEFDRMSDEELADYIARENGEISKTVN